MPDEFEEWVTQLAVALNLDPGQDVDGLLQLARVVAHRIDRRAAPVTTFLVGLAAGRDGASRDAIEKVFGVAMDLAQSRPPKGAED